MSSFSSAVVETQHFGPKVASCSKIRLFASQYFIPDDNLYDVSAMQTSDTNENVDIWSVVAGTDKDVENIDDMKEINFDSISDEEVLLACRAFLARKHRLQWTERKRRRKQASLATRAPASMKKKIPYSSETETRGRNTLVSTVGDGSTTDTNHVAVGYFWEDPSELVFLGKDNKARSFLRDALIKFSDQDVDEEKTPSPLQADTKGDGTKDRLDLLNDYEDDEEGKLTYNQQEIEGNEDDYDKFFDISPEEVGTYPLSLKPPSSTGESRPLAISLLGEKFTSFPSTPDTIHETKSTALKMRFANPEWKAKWHRKRWGEEGRMISSEERKIKQINSKLDRMPSAVLESKELLTLTDEELKEAIEIYLKSNMRKAKAHEKRNERRQQEPNFVSDKPKINAGNQTSNVPSDNMHSKNRKWTESVKKSEDQLIKPYPLTFSFGEGDSGLSDAKVELKKKRSEAAKRRYQARKENQRKRRPVQVSSFPTSSTELTINQEHDSVLAAMKRLQASLNDPNADFQSIHRQDIECIMQPLRMAQRRQIMVQILEEKFGCLGKCIPRNRTFTSDAKEAQLVFVQHATIRELGDHVIRLLENGTC